MGLILLRYGELALKGGNRIAFLRRLRQNVRAALKAHGLSGEVTSVERRVYVRTEQVEEALDPLSRVFGLTSISPVAEARHDMDDIIRVALAEAQAAGVAPGVSFRVRARRSDKTFPYTSPEINRLAGGAIHDALHGKVDLSDNADVTIGIEVSREEALVFARTIPAPGGLPLGIEGRVVALMSGGIDSPVAAWMMMKRGCGVIPVHFTQSDLETSKAMDNIEVLRRYSYGWDLKPLVFSHYDTIAPTLAKLQAIGEERWSCIFCKRALMQKACEVAEEFGAHAVVMGDALGQVASQTLANMEVTTFGMTKPIFRPLIGLDKTEIVQLAQRIGTFEVSTRAEGTCQFLPCHPITQGSVPKLLEIIRQLEEMENVGS
jgi:thiamine biosynthesis protein ThiI